jgi:hypothetical protein
MMRTSRIGLLGAAAAAGLALISPLSANAASVQVAYWKMNDTGTTMADSSGRGHIGALHSVRVQQAGMSGSVGYGFLSKPSYVSVPSHSDLNPGTGNFSYTVRVRFSSRPSSSVGDYDLVRKGLASSSGGDYKMEILGSGAGYCEFRGSSGLGAVTGSTNLADNAWHTITCARTPTSVRLTVDGSTRSRTVNTGTISNSSAVYIGAKDGSGADQYTGYMDSVTVSKG